MNFQCYGYLFGKIKLIKDTHRDEVFIEETNLIVIQNNVWLFDYLGLVAIAKEILGDDLWNEKQ